MSIKGQPLRRGAACEGEPRQPLRRCGASSPLRTETPLRDVPVLRMAFFPKRAYDALFSKTLMLQVRCAHPTGTGEPGQPLSPLRRTAPPFAPKRPFGTFRCCAWLILRKEHTMLFSPKRTCFRFAARTLRVQGSRRATPQALRASSPYTGEPGQPLRRCAPAPLTQGSQGNPSVCLRQPAPPFAPKRPFGTFRCCAWLFSEKSILCSFRKKAHASGSLREPYGYRGAKATLRAALLREKRPRRRLLRGRWKRGIGIFTASGGCRPVRCGRH